MYDHSLFLKTLSEFTGTLLMPYDLDTVLGDLADRLTKVLALGGTGVTLADQDRLQPVTAVPPSIAEVEGIQYEHQSGPCVDAFRTGRVVAIADLGQVSDRWPEYCSAAQRLGVCSVAGYRCDCRTRQSGRSPSTARVHGRGRGPNRTWRRR
jgi:hypothetical protein